MLTGAILERQKALHPNASDADGSTTWVCWRRRQETLSKLRKLLNMPCKLIQIMRRRERIWSARGPDQEGLNNLFGIWRQREHGIVPAVQVYFLGMKRSAGGVILYVWAKLRWLMPMLNRPRESM
jgi:hypothetical protein